MSATGSGKFQTAKEMRNAELPCCGIRSGNRKGEVAYGVSFRQKDGDRGILQSLV